MTRTSIHIFLSLLVLIPSMLFAATQGGQVTMSELPGASILVDVRSIEEWNAGHAGGALHLPVDQVEQSAATLLPDQDAEIVTYCRSGRRAQHAAQLLTALGYRNVRALIGSYEDLRAAGH